jgi:bacterial/archaeal transporter family-2 protein
MALTIFAAFGAGLLISLSRQLNGRLSLATSPLASSFWNHWVGFAALVLFGAVAGGLWPATVADVPIYAWVGGPLGVVFIALGSYCLSRLGAARTAMLVIAGQMVTGAALDLARGQSGSVWMTAAGVALIIGGMAMGQRARD